MCTNPLLGESGHRSTPDSVVGDFCPEFTEACEGRTVVRVGGSYQKRSGRRARGRLDRYLRGESQQERPLFRRVELRPGGMERRDKGYFGDF